MFFENKSVDKTDLETKSTVQHRVICDWLRNIDKKLTRIERQIVNLNRSVESLLENDSSAESMARELDDK